MKKRPIIEFLFLLLIAAGCTLQFFPDVDESKDLLVVEGMITDQNRKYSVKLSRSAPIGQPLMKKVVRGATVTITDEKGVVTTLKEYPLGTYTTDSTKFTGRIGGRYSLRITSGNRHYETDFIEMKPVPPIDSVYYQKVTINASKDSSDIDEGCRIFVDSYDPTGKCLFFRWEYIETWEYRIPYSVVNRICWVYNRSDEILIKNTSVYNQARVTGYEVNYVTNRTDRLKVKYSILVNQYSVTREEYDFWERVKAVSQNVGNLYDVTPSAVPSNIRCTTNPEEVVLGYFSVSAVSQKRLWIVDTFLGLPNFPLYCATDTLYWFLPLEGQNTSYWVIEDYSNEVPPAWVITTFRECADCTTEGTKIKPPFWDEYYLEKR